MLMYPEISEVKIVHSDILANELLQEGWHLMDEFNHNGLVSFVLALDYAPDYDYQAMYTGEATI